VLALSCLRPRRSLNAVRARDSLPRQRNIQHCSSFPLPSTCPPCQVRDGRSSDDHNRHCAGLHRRLRLCRGIVKLFPPCALSLSLLDHELPLCPVHSDALINSSTRPDLRRLFEARRRSEKVFGGKRFERRLDVPLPLRRLPGLPRTLLLCSTGLLKPSSKSGEKGLRGQGESSGRACPGPALASLSFLSSRISPTLCRVSLVSTRACTPHSGPANNSHPAPRPRRRAPDRPPSILAPSHHPFDVFAPRRRTSADPLPPSVDSLGPAACVTSGARSGESSCRLSPGRPVPARSGFRLPRERMCSY
jgi:hypothetical protein